MSQITTHILDTSTGAPAEGVPLQLSEFDSVNNEWSVIVSAVTNHDGRVPNLLGSAKKLAAGTYRVHFETSVYFKVKSQTVFYPWVDVVFQIDGSGEHYHIPLLLSPFGYSTYRGS